MKLHTQCAYKDGSLNSLWGWAWKDLAAVFLGLVRGVTPTKREQPLQEADAWDDACRTNRSEQISGREKRTRLHAL